MRDKSIKKPPLSQEAEAFIEKVYKCEPPCDTFGVCTNCYDKVNFGAGYNIGYRAAVDRRGRFIECRGCPTVECTCFTELESELLDKCGELLKALGFNTYAQFVERPKKLAPLPVDPALLAELPPDDEL